MRSQSRNLRRLVTLLVVSTAVAIGAVAFISAARDDPQPGATQRPAVILRPVIPRGTPVVTVQPAVEGRPIQPGFVGLSIEYTALEAYAGQDPSAVNPVFEQLIRNLAPGQAPVLRIGGDSTDHAWVPVPYLSRPPGVTFNVTPRWIAVMSALSRAVGARDVLGIDLEADSLPLARAMAYALISGIGRARIEALEIGNEPELYGTFGWYNGPGGRPVTGRSPDYGFTAFNQDFSNFAGAMPNLPLAGPTSGGPVIGDNIPEFIAAQPRLRLITIHRYPLQRCFVEAGTPQFPTIPNLLAPTASQGLAATVAASVAAAHAHGLPLRVDELNSVACSGAHGVSDTFASALWVIDALFNMARAGVDGVNIHTLPTGVYAPFTFTHAHGAWSGSVKPMYYGMILFAQAAPPGSRLLQHFGTVGPAVRTWATLAPDGRIRVVLINEGSGRARFAVVRVRGAGIATVSQLVAPWLGAKHRVKFGGQSFGSQTTTGLLAGTPETIAEAPSAAGEYLVRLPAYSATLVTIAR